METKQVERFTFFWKGPLSQWYSSPFVGEDGFQYNCAEQYMMDKKAELFEDKTTQIAIRNALHPREQKALGRVVKGFDVNVWNRHARSIVYEGNRLKFMQNPMLRLELYATYGTTLVEASSKDKIWGIGLSESDPRALNRSTWLGSNWLGETLTKLRDDLMTLQIQTM